MEDDEAADEQSLNVIYDHEEETVAEEPLVESSSLIGRRPGSADLSSQSETTTLTISTHQNRFSFAPEAGRGAPLAELALGEILMLNCFSVLVSENFSCLKCFDILFVRKYFSYFDFKK